MACRLWLKFEQTCYDLHLYILFVLLFLCDACLTNTLPFEIVQYLDNPASFDSSVVLKVTPSMPHQDHQAVYDEDEFSASATDSSQESELLEVVNSDDSSGSHEPAPLNAVKPPPRKANFPPNPTVLWTAGGSESGTGREDAGNISLAAQTELLLLQAVVETNRQILQQLRSAQGLDSPPGPWESNPILARYDKGFRTAP